MRTNSGPFVGGRWEPMGRPVAGIVGEHGVDVSTSLLAKLKRLALAVKSQVPFHMFL